MERNLNFRSKFLSDMIPKVNNIGGKVSKASNMRTYRVPKELGFFGFFRGGDF